MKSSIFFYLFISFVAGSPLYCGTKPIHLDSIFAVVNGNIVLESEVMELVRRMPDYRENISPPSLKNLQMKVINNFINDYLVIDIAKEHKVEVTEDELDEAAKEQIDEIKSRFPDEDSFNKAIRKDYTTVKDLKDRYQRQIKPRLYKEKYMAKVLSAEVEVTDIEIKQMYDSMADEVRVKHILVEDEKNARDILDKIKNGESFEDMARQYSIDGSGKNGGDLGDFFKRTDLVKPFADAAFQLDKGQISDVVHTRFGYHIIKLIEKRTVDIEPLDDKSTNMLRNYIYAQKMETILSQQIAEYKKSCYVDIRIKPSI